jgi:hypothetical protein
MNESNILRIAKALKRKLAGPVAKVEYQRAHPKKTSRKFTKRTLELMRFVVGGDYIIDHLRSRRKTSKDKRIQAA